MIISIISSNAQDQIKIEILLEPDENIYEKNFRQHLTKF